MMHQLTITVDDNVYQALKPMVEQETIGSFLNDFMKERQKSKTTSSITALRGTLHKVDTSDLRDETDRPI
ncbi:MAG: hypothetical protein FWB83_00950 [Treponema sp.]|nr:hypothetical protein [Treponema sp.]